MLIKGPLAGANVGNFLEFVTTPSVTVLPLGSVYVLVILTRWMDIWGRQTLYGAWGALPPAVCLNIIKNFGTVGRGGCQATAPTPKRNLKTQIFLDTMISNFTWLNLQPKSAIKIGWWIVLFFWHNSPPPPQWTRASSFTRFLYHTQRRTTLGRTSLDECSVRRRDLYQHTTQHSLQTDIHALGAIRTQNLSRGVAADLCLRPRGHWDRH